MSTVGHEFSVVAPAAGRRGSKTGYRSRVAAHPVAAFFLLAYGFSWLFWLAPAFGLRGPAGAVLLYVGVFGPAVAAATITRLAGGSLRAWLRALVQFRAAPRWYVTVIGFPIVLVAALTAAFVATVARLRVRCWASGWRPICRC